MKTLLMEACKGLMVPVSKMKRQNVRVAGTLFAIVMLMFVATEDSQGATGDPSFGLNAYSLNDTNDSYCFAMDGACETCSESPGSSGNNRRNFALINRGLAGWHVSEPLLNLWIIDTPLHYPNPKGPDVAIQLAYKQRGLVERDTNVFSFGPNWAANFLAFVEGYSTNAVLLHYSDGSTRTYKPDGKWIEKHAGSRMATVMQGGTIVGYRMEHGDGATEYFGFDRPDTRGTNRFFLTLRSDPTGNSITNIYSSDTNCLRLDKIRDLDARDTYIRYTNNAWSSNLICEIEDPFGRKAKFDYSSTGRLLSITDPISLISEFEYSTSGVITNLTTAYGVTKFTIAEALINFATNALVRTIRVEDSNGAKQLWVYGSRSDWLSNSDSEHPSGLSTDLQDLLNNNKLTNCNSWHWSRRAHDALSIGAKTNIYALTVNDYDIATLKNWLQVSNTTNLVPSRSINMMREGKASTNGSAIVGQKVWFGYEGKTEEEEYREGLHYIPDLRVLVLPTGSNSYQRTQVDDRFFQPTNRISTYTKADGSIGARNVQSVLSTNGIDVLRVIGPDGTVQLARSYNTYHQPVSETNGVEYITEYSYNADHLLELTKYPTGLYRTNSLSGEGHLLQISYSQTGHQETFTYVNNLVQTYTDARGLRTTNVYDALNRPIEFYRTDGSVRSNGYARLDLVYTSDWLGNVTKHTYDSMGWLTKTVLPNGSTNTFNRCSCGSLESATDGENKTTSFSYDLLGRETTITFADSSWTRTYFNRMGQATNVTTSAGASITNTYNNQGLLARSMSQYGQMTAVLYDLYDRSTNSVDRNGHISASVRDSLGRPTREQRLQSGGSIYSSTAMTYGPSGVVAMTNELGYVTKYGYDAASRKIAETNANQEVTQFAYTAAGDLSTLTDGKNQVTTWYYDVFGRPTNKLDAAANSIFLYRYDANGRLINRWTPAKLDAGYTYDSVGNLTKVDYTNSPDLTLSYDRNNRLTNMVDAVGTSRFSYDAVGRLLSEDGPWTQDTVTFTYTNGLRASLSLQQPFGTAWSQAYGYDAVHRLKSVIAGETTMTYDYVTNINSVAVPTRLPITLSYGSGSRIRYQFDTYARLTQTRLETSGGSVLNQHDYVYNEADQRSKQTFTETNYVDYAYDPIGQLVKAEGKENGGAVRDHERLGYRYDAAGNLSSRTNNALIQGFNVNTLNELTTVGRSGTLTAAGFTTPAATNVTVNTQSASLYADKTFAKAGFSLVDGDNTFTAIGKDSLGRSDTNVVVANLPLTNTFAYDLNGNLRTNGTRVFDYDDENQLIRITEPTLWKSEFSYDGRMRRRIRQEFTWSAGAWTMTNEVRYVYDHLLVVQERHFFTKPVTNNFPESLVTYARGNDLSGRLQGAGGIGGLLMRLETANGNEPASTAFYHADGNGNVTAMVNVDGTALVARYLYDPFGNQLASGGILADRNVYRFSSKEWHNCSSLYYYLYRFYSAPLQRWLNRDPLEEGGGLNLYRCFGNCPIMFIDFDGLATTGIATPGLAGILADEAAIEAAKIAAAKAASMAAALALATATTTGTSLCPKPPTDPCEVFNTLRNHIQKNHPRLLGKVGDVVMARGSQADLDAIPGMTKDLRNVLAAMYEAAGDCNAPRGVDQSNNRDRAAFMRGELKNAPGKNPPVGNKGGKL